MTQDYRCREIFSVSFRSLIFDKVLSDLRHRASGWYTAPFCPIQGTSPEAIPGALAQTSSASLFPGSELCHCTADFNPNAFETAVQVARGHDSGTRWRSSADRDSHSC